MKAQAKAVTFNLDAARGKIKSSLGDARSFVSGKLTSARSSALTRVVDAGEKLTERQIALLGRLRDRAAH